MLFRLIKSDQITLKRLSLNALNSKQKIGPIKFAVVGANSRPAVRRLFAECGNQRKAPLFIVCDRQGRYTVVYYNSKACSGYFSSDFGQLLHFLLPAMYLLGL
ncbi:hypothetical protein LJC48_05260 [Desulfovibrio sp. OttesenSCG-928-C06]|nr:hypothetical protein [Desulfovibrio sp. OttesenSCG-928-C06]